MAITFVAGGAQSVVGSGTSLTVNHGGLSLVVGDLLLAATTIASSRVPTWPALWTAIGAGAFAYHIVPSGAIVDPIVTWTGSSAQGGVIFQFRGGDLVNPIGANADNQAQTGTSATCPAITTTRNNTLCVAMVVEGSFAVPSTPAGYGLLASDSTGITATMGWLAASLAEPTSGVTTPSVTSTVASGTWRTALVELTNAGDAVTGGGGLLLRGFGSMVVPLAAALIVKNPCVTRRFWRHE